jgi:hypothetical protein
MKRFALNLILGVAFAAASSIACAGGGDSPTIKNNSMTSGSLTVAVLCATGFTSYCVTQATNNNLQIKNN